MNKNNFLNELPLLKLLTSNIDDKIFENVYLLACQHILPSVHLMLNSMVKLGLKKERTALIGKCYSTSKLAMNNMISEDYYVCPSSKQYDSHKSFDDQFQQNINNFIDEQLKRMNIPFDAKILIIDDGGELISAIQNQLVSYPNIYCVEQTSAGYNKLKEINLNYPVVNVARCFSKLKYESPIISQTVINNIFSLIENLNIEVNKCLILGNGSIGNNIFQELNKIMDVSTYDLKSHKTHISPNDLDLSLYNLIIGTTGKNSIANINHLNLKKNTVLASASSSDREFDAVYLRKIIAQNNDCHATIKANDIYLLNSGFPLNFLGSDYDSISIEQIQLVIALLFMGSCQLLLTNKYTKGLMRINSSYQKMVLDNFLKLQKDFSANVMEIYS